MLTENDVAYTTKENYTSSPDLIQLSDSDCNTSQVSYSFVHQQQNFFSNIWVQVINMQRNL